MRTVAAARIDVSAMIEFWVAAGTVTAEQAAQMRADVSGIAETPGSVRDTARGASLVTEAMGYLGGVIILVASGLVTAWFWTDMPTAVRLSLAAGVAVLLLVAGAAASQRVDTAPRDRLRSVLWLLASAALAAFLGLTASETLGWEDERVALFAAGGTALMSAVLWYLHPHLLQHAATFVPLVVVAGTATSLLAEPSPLAESGALPGAAVWGFGAVWAALAWGGLLPARHQGMVFGAVALVFASIVVVGENWGAALALFTVAGLVVVAVVLRDLVLLAVASVGALLLLPPIMSRLFPGMLSAALALLAVGVLLVAVAVVTARRRKPPSSTRPTTLATRH